MSLLDGLLIQITWGTKARRAFEVIEWDFQDTWKKGALTTPRMADVSVPDQTSGAAADELPVGLGYPLTA